ncbi:MAG: hypothetical protein MUC81_02295 [Bacteroidia bacterium]|jgi:hypothetical protein|nr:hypothetical protein [Bacteroidia bacterium]
MNKQQLSLANGTFSAKDAMQLIHDWVDVKIKYHESKIAASLDAEDVKMREHRIQKLQSDRANLREWLKAANDKVTLHVQLEME